MKLNSLQDIAGAFNGLKALIIGDIMVDAYVWGKVDRISPEAPVPVVHVSKRESRMGGAANVAKNIKALGAEPVICALVGEDQAGSDLLDLFVERNIPTEGIIQSKERVTTVKERLLAGSQQLMRVDSEEDRPLSAEEHKEIMERIRLLLPECDVVIFEDYDKGVINEHLVEEVVSMAREKGIPTVVDPKKRNFLAYRRVDLFKPNLKEIKEGLKIDFEAKKPEELRDAVRQLLAALNAEAALVTMSELGVYIDNGTEHHHIEAHIRQISDVSGAGDTVISIASLCMALKLPLDFTAALSNLGGGLVCEHLGVVPIDKERLFAEAAENKLL
ncbi:carbohydrate kinase [Fulvitalea axinellae]|uniref:Carbohydrate kinase n=1 Tax=Fulvitalea axinellae TaxID=1182444 RepID=A0AAU9D6T2_9BACT|nr:carbohydrate kinase [Fulvitalea axinellae]